MKYFQTRFLIVDDEPSHRLILKELLQELWAFQGDVVEAETGREAIKIFQEWQPNVILMDLQMPDINGYEAIRLIRTLEESYCHDDSFLERMDTQPQIIVVSASVTEADRTHAFTVGCNAFVKKPYNFQELFQTIHGAMLRSSTASSDNPTHALFQ